ncbi:hypothetical protein PH547_20635 [Rhizobium sp. CNPSo 3464]|uniref:hypothetical protein n=1 Tax=Rhizobium sp. CNPSo 3464 TaxID=3021406 RepID=UPI00254F18CA|nr:hypothetical protein [Rhizobium sp. CNPSo 3464]MDK4741299.1 hypothetical protein [Rhizobium sp. CNPSo 3464]
MRDTDNANAREDGTPLPGVGDARESIVSSKGEFAADDPAVGGTQAAGDSAVGGTQAAGGSGEAVARKPVSWPTILVLAGVLSLFSFATGFEDSHQPVGAQSILLSMWHNTPNLRFLLTFFLISACLGLTALSQNFASAWANVRRVLESGVFYFFAGLALLLYAKQGTDAAEHPSITFILAMLGVAIMLFGTGSQAAGAIATGSGTLPSLPKNGSDAATLEQAVGGNAAPAGDWSPFKANAVIAGGAAVLTAIFGFGVIQYADKIPGVFTDYGTYSRVMIRPCLAAASGSCTETDINSFIEANLSLGDYSVSAQNADGRELFVRKENKTIQILALKDDMRSGRYISLKFDRVRDAPPGTLLASSVSVEVPLFDVNKSLGDGCVTGSGVVTRCRLSPTDNASTNRSDKLELVTFALDLSGGAQPGSVSVQTAHFDPMSNAVKPVTIQLQ